jgi:tetratricopeptide (TPR) repeat protein
VRGDYTPLVSVEPETPSSSLRDALRAAPVTAYRDFFRLQEDLRDRGDAESARALAEELWAVLPELSFPSEEESARFHHNVAVFFGSPGDAADLARARRCFETALSWWREPEETGWHARVLHNFATALANLGTEASELDESIALFERALTWRTKEREIARAVTLHHLGIARRRRAELRPEDADDDLERSAHALTEAAAIRKRHGLGEGRALSLFHLAVTLERLAGGEPGSVLEEARRRYAEAADEFVALGMETQADVSRRRLKALD